MKILVHINQAQAIKKGINAPQSTAVVDIDPAALSQIARDFFASQWEESEVRSAAVPLGRRVPDPDGAFRSVDRSISIVALPETMVSETIQAIEALAQELHDEREQKKRQALATLEKATEAYKSGDFAGLHFNGCSYIHYCDYLLCEGTDEQKEYDRVKREHDEKQRVIRDAKRAEEKRLEDEKKRLEERQIKASDAELLEHLEGVDLARAELLIAETGWLSYALRTKAGMARLLSDYEYLGAIPSRADNSNESRLVNVPDEYFESAQEMLSMGIEGLIITKLWDRVKDEDGDWDSANERWVALISRQVPGAGEVSVEIPLESAESDE